MAALYRAHGLFARKKLALLGWATHHANTIDPRSRSLEGFEVWLKKFQLKH